MIWLFEHGGTIILILGGLSVVACTVFLQKLSRFRRARLELEEFSTGLVSRLKDGNLRDAIAFCREGPDPYPRIFEPGLLRHASDRREIQEVIQDRAGVEMKSYERGLGVLSTIARVAPLLGLLGTVIGMILAFMEVESAMTDGLGVQAASLSAGIWQALITTAAGLIVAIPVYLGHNYLLSLRDDLFTRLEDQALVVVSLLEQVPGDTDALSAPVENPAEGGSRESRTPAEGVE